MPSYNESFGLVAIEAQACGTPVVAAAVGGLVTAVRDGVSGVLVDAPRPGRLGRGARPTCSPRPARRRALSEGAVRHAHEFSWSHTASGLLAAYRDALDHHRDAELLGWRCHDRVPVSARPDRAGPR